MKLDLLEENVRFKKNQRCINLSSLYNYEISLMLKKNVRFKKSQRGILMLNTPCPTKVFSRNRADHFLETVKHQ